jgi:hypothetical protein
VSPLEFHALRVRIFPPARNSNSVPGGAMLPVVVAGKTLNC